MFSPLIFGSAAGRPADVATIVMLSGFVMSDRLGRDRHAMGTLVLIDGARWTIRLTCEETGLWAMTDSVSFALERSQIFGGHAAPVEISAEPAIAMAVSWSVNRLVMSLLSGAALLRKPVFLIRLSRVLDTGEI